MGYMLYPPTQSLASREGVTRARDVVPQSSVTRFNLKATIVPFFHNQTLKPGVLSSRRVSLLHLCPHRERQQQRLPSPLGVVVSEQAQNQTQWFRVESAVILFQLSNFETGCAFKPGSSLAQSSHLGVLVQLLARWHPHNHFLRFAGRMLYITYTFIVLGTHNIQEVVLSSNTFNSVLGTQHSGMCDFCTM